MLNRRQFCMSLASAALLSGMPQLAMAQKDDVQLMGATLKPTAAGLELAVNWEFDLSQTLYESLLRGVALYFVYAFTLERSRTMWFDKTVLESSILQRLSYSPLSRQFRVSRDGLTQSFETLDMALFTLKNVRAWIVSDTNPIEDFQDFKAQTHMQLDLSRLPKPLQVTVGGNSDWAMSSAWEPVALTRVLNHEP